MGGNMQTIKVTHFRSHLQEYLSKVQKGEEVCLTSHGKVIARIVPPIDTQTQAINRLKELRKHCKIGDVISPLKEKWEVE
jgi:prevent-host-death family protein